MAMAVNWLRRNWTRPIHSRALRLVDAGVMAEH